MQRATLLLLLLAVCFTATATPEAAAATPTAVFWSGLGGHPCIRVPSLLTLPDRLLAFAECRSFTGDGCEPAGNATTSQTTSGAPPSSVKDRSICMRTSTDSGHSWGPLAGNISRGKGMYPTAVWEPSKRRVLLHFNSWPADVHSSYYSPVTRQIMSSDHGATWSSRTPVLGLGVSGIFLGSCRGVAIRAGPHAGRVVFAGYNHSLPRDTMSKTYTWWSDDAGDSWSLAPVGVRAMAETQPVELPTGELALFGRSNKQLGCACQDRAQSTDGGLSWSSPANITSLPSPNCQGSVLALSAVSVGSSGSAGGDSGSAALWYSGPGSATVRKGMTIFRSTDGGGAEWQVAAAIGAADADAMYSCMDAMPAADAEPTDHGRQLGLLWETSMDQQSDGNTSATGAASSCVGPGCRIVFTATTLKSDGVGAKSWDET